VPGRVSASLTLPPQRNLLNVPCSHEMRCRKKDIHYRQASCVLYSFKSSTLSIFLIPYSNPTPVSPPYEKTETFPQCLTEKPHPLIFSPATATKPAQFRSYEDMVGVSQIVTLTSLPSTVCSSRTFHIHPCRRPRLKLTLLPRCGRRRSEGRW